MPVYNEEARIKNALQSLKYWCDEIFILDKQSTDNTVKICEEYGAKVTIVPNSSTYSVNEFDYLSQLSGDWIFFMTASDIIDVSLGLELKRLINSLPEDVAVIKIPLQYYVLGIGGKKSPWYEEYRNGPFRKDSYTINNNVHVAFTFKGNEYKVPEKFGYMYHLTHVSVDMLMERHNRYWRGEAAYYEYESLKPAFHYLLHFVRNVFTRRSIFGGWDYFALSCAYLAYGLMSFVYKWEVKNNKASKTYDEMRKKNFDAWSKIENMHSYE